ncbi:MAG TPA: D-alanine--D-alanine ligase [Acidobacteriota bacterium]|jgi:D-alanine-D-alanine ligase|nr:D-alanine--D-alanine ligase [Acidobacteriota bacterium]
MTPVKTEKLRVALFMGGRSEEREVSLNTGKMIARHLDKNKYEILPLEIDRDGKWLLDSPTLREIEAAGQAKIDAGLIRSVSPTVLARERSIDVVFLALHGPYGEDGTIQGMLELLGIPYTCSGVLASALAMDKFRMKAFVRGLGMRVAADTLVSPLDFERHRSAVLERIHSLGNKTVIKPNRLGSSVATFIVDDSSQTERALLEVFRLDQDALVEEFIEGVEITAPVLGNGQPEALPLIEIVPNLGKFYDYQSKYADGGSDHIIPARLSHELACHIQQQAIDVHLYLGCRGVTRSDFIVRDQEAYFLEINTIPGMTAVSLAPQSAQVAGYTFSQFLDKLIELALEGNQD